MRLPPNYVRDVRIHPDGDLVFVGSSGPAVVAKLARNSGATVWESTWPAERNPDSAGKSMAFEADGDVVVVGQDYYQFLYQVRTARFAASDGRLLWMKASDMNAGAYGSDVAVTDRHVYVLGTSNDESVGSQSGQSYVRIRKLDKLVPEATANVQGLWWNSPAGTESGWGINFAHQGENLFATWFTYDTDGRAVWFVVPDATRVEHNLYRGKWYRTTGPVFSSSPFNPASIVPIELGTASFEFENGALGAIHFSNTSVRHTRRITRQEFALPLPTCTHSAGPRVANYQDLWWGAPAGSESGWGLNLTHQQDIIFATWFTYDTDGKPLWLVGPDVRRVGNSQQFTGPLYRTRASWYLQYLPSSLTSEPVGTITLTFGSPDQGVFAYTVGNTSQSKNIVRQHFADPPTVCH